MTEEERSALEAALGHHFRDVEWLERALTHRSRRPALTGSQRDNERLEFLGDRVLGLVVSEYLVRTFADWEAGKLSKSTARLVSASVLQEASRRMDLGRYLRLGRGEEKTGGREKRNLLADAYEAVVGAIYRDGGLEAAHTFVVRTLLAPAVAKDAEPFNHADHKSVLQEWLQQRKLSLATYRVVKEFGPDHRKTFVVEVLLGGRKLAQSQGRSKKEAEQAAARQALEVLQREEQGVPES